jgi:WD40 repeat protein
MASILTILAWIVFFQTTDIAGPVRTASAKPTSLEIPSKQLNLVAFSRDGNTLASTDGGLIVLWDVASGQERSTLSSQTTSLVSDIVFSQDGKTLASVSDNSIQLWDVVSGSARLTLPARGLVTNLVFSPDGKTLAAADQDDAQIKLWNSQSGSTNQIQTGHQNGVNVLVFSPDSSIIATGGKDAQIKLWDRVTGLESSQLTADISGAVTQLVFSPDGKTLAAVSQDDAQVTLWDSQSGAITQVQTGHQGGVNALAFSPDSKILSTGGQDARIKLWNRATGIEQVNLTGEVGAPVTSLVFSSDGQFLASVGESEKVFLWDVSKIQPQLLSGHTDWVDKIVFSSNKTLAGIDKSGQVILWNLLTGLEQETFQIPNFLSASLVNSQAQFVGNTISGASLQAGVSNTTAVTNSTSKTDASSLGTSENPTGKSKKKSAQKWKGVKAIAISQDGLEIGTASEDGMFRVFKKNGSQRWEVSGHHGKAIAGIAYLGKSKEWASVGRDTEITTWNATGKKIQTFYGPEHPPRALAVSPDGQFIATAGEETRVFLFDTKAGKLSAIFSGHVDFVNGLAFSPDGNTLASAGADGRIVLWEVRTGKPLRTLLGHADEVNTVAFSPDGGRLASASMDSTVILWNSSTGGQIKTLAGHQASVRTVAFNPNGKELVSAGEDTKMLVWDSTTGILKKQLAGPPAAINALVFGSDGILHAASENSDISEFNTDTGTNIETIVVPVSATVAPQASRSEIITVAMISNTVGLIASHLTEKSDLDSVKPNHATLSAIVNQLLDWVIPAANADVLPDPNQGPGGPILVVTTTADPFGRYYAEILRTEGLNAFTVTDISTVNTSLLSAYDVVILAPATLTPVQVTMFTDWVSSGGNLIAMRPDAQLANLLGLTDTGATLAEGYLLVDTSRAPGNGIVNQTIQFHGSAKRYTLNGASSLATLYSNASTLTTNPALTLSDVGTNGGQAAAFSFDLARSIVYTRQGNPAWATQERDGFTPIRSDDKFFGNATGDPQADWIDFNKIAIPQADEQQRLLANLILHMNSDKKPLPRFWYFPNGKKAVVIMTGDDHANNGTQGRFDQFIANSTPGCSVANWECIRGTSYIYPNTPLTPALAASYNTQGFEVGLHINTNCADFTPASLRTFYTQQIDTFKTKYSTIPAPITQRHHCIAWSDWVTGAIVQLENGIRFDTSYYFWPPSWVLNRPGFFSGSGMPMRFANLDGSMIDVYHAASQMTDESGQTYPFTIDTLLDRALGTEGYYGAFTINAHTDVATIPESDAVLASAPSRGVPIVSSKQMLDWLDGRNSSSFGTIAWNANALSFTVNQGTGANGLQVMLPLVSSAGVLTSVTRDGLSVSFTTDAIKGVTYAAFSGTTGAYVATYAVDITLPTVITQSPANGAASISQGASVTATFSKAMDAATVTTSTFELRDSSNNVVSATVSYNASTLTATLTPTASLPLLLLWQLASTLLVNYPTKVGVGI